MTDALAALRVRRSVRGSSARVDDLIGEAVLHDLCCTQYTVSVSVVSQRLDVTSGVAAQGLLDLFTNAQDLLGGEDQVGNRSTPLAGGLMEQNARVRKH